MKRFIVLGMVLVLVPTAIASATPRNTADIFFEDFEDATFPPDGWSVTGSDAWEVLDSDAPEGLQYANAAWGYDVDEWLISPTINTTIADIALGGVTHGSPYWGRPVEQGGMYDNYDVEVYVKTSDKADEYVGLLDGFWVDDDWSWGAFELDLTGLYPLGEDFQIGFRYVGDDGADCGIDAVFITPEPTSLMLLAIGGMALVRRR